MKIHFRTDGSFFEEGDTKPPPLPGDTWRIHWYNHVDGVQVNDQIAGYAICCPLCLKVHHWTTANNCPRIAGEGCAHEKAHTSCWTWTGSAEDGTLTASPSLYSVEALGGCGWHGWLHDGELHT